jgi:hypothetical protein
LRFTGDITTFFALHSSDTLFLLRKRDILIKVGGFSMQNSTFFGPPAEPAKKPLLRPGALLGLFILAGLAACSLAMPEKVHVRGNPVFTAEIKAPDFDMDEYLSTGEIESQLGDDSFKVYEYADPASGAKTFLLHYDGEAWDLEVDPEDFNFDLSGEGGAIDAAIVDVPDLSELAAETLVLENTVGAIPAEGGQAPVVPPHTPLQTGDCVKLNDGLTDFEEAEVGRGYVVLSGSNLLFDDVKIDCYIGGASDSDPVTAYDPPKQLTMRPGEPGRYSLEGVSLNKESVIYISGNLTAGPGGIPAEDFNIHVEPYIEELRTVKVKFEVEKTNDANVHRIPVDYGSLVGTVNRVKFKELGAAFKLSHRIEGLKLKVELDGPRDPVLDGLATDPLVDGGFVNLCASEEAFLEGDKFTIPGAPATSFDLDLDNYPNPFDLIFTIENNDPGNFLVVHDVELRDKDDNPVTQMEITAEPIPIFDWISATVLKSFPGEDDPGGEFNLAELTEALEDTVSMDNIKFDDISLYLYTSAPASLINNTSLGITARWEDNGQQDLTGGVLRLKNPGSVLPGLELGKIYTGTLPSPQLMNNEKPLQLAGVFNARPGKLRLDLEIEAEKAALSAGSVR